MNNDLISRSAHIDKFKAEAKKIAANDKDFAQALMYVVTCLDAAPAVDAVEVVRCGECEHWMYINDDVGLCVVDVPDIDGVVRNADFFCKYGERRK